MRTLDRRAWIKLVAISTAAMGCRSKGAPTTDAATATASTSAAPAVSGKVLGAAEWRTLDALTARILPSDATAGAREAEVTRFIDRQLQTKELAPLAGAVVLCARLIDEHAQTKHARPFADLAADAQDSIVAGLSKGELTLSRKFPQRELFRLLHGLTLEGFLGDPIQGGNEAMVGWRSIGFPTPTLRTAGSDEHHVHLPVAPSTSGK